MKKCFLFICMILSTLLLPLSGYSGDVKISWTANTESDFSFYRVYYGTSTRNYGIPIKVSDSTEYTISLPDDGNTYYFAVTAVDNVGNESGYSAEVSKKMDAPSLELPSTDLITNLTVASGKPYEIHQGLSEGAQSYYDRTTYTYTGVPEELINATYIRTSHGDMGIRDNDSFISFNLNANSDIYVVLDDLNTTRPSGMEDFTDTGHDFKFYRNMSLLKKSFNAGPVVFGTNRSGDMYTIIVSSQGTAESDTQVPEVLITSPTSTGNYDTKNASLDLSGTASDNIGLNKVTWSSDRGVFGTASGTESWSVSGVALTEGVNTITVTAEDSSGNSKSATLAVTYTAPDTQAPELTISSPVSDGSYSTDQPSVSLSGTASDNLGIQVITWTHSEGGSGTASGTVSWTVSDIGLVEGDNHISVVAMDAAGNKASKSLVVTYSPPQLIPKELISNLSVASGKPYVIQQGLSEGAQSYYDRTTYIYTGIPEEIVNATYIQTSHGDMGVRGNDSFIRFDLNADAEVYVVLDDLNTTRPAGMEGFSDTGHDFKFYRNMSLLKKSFSPGPVVFGTNRSGDMYAIIVASQGIPAADTQAPEVVITSPTSSGSYSTKNSTLSISGTARDDTGLSKVTWSSDKGGSGTASGIDSWSVSDLVLSEGVNTIKVTAEDGAGNIGSTTLAVTYTPPDIQAPELIISSPVSDGSYGTEQSTANLAGTASDDRLVTRVTWFTDKGGSGTASGTASWSVSGVALSEGMNIITVSAEDGAGNSTSKNLTVTYTPPDIQAPQLMIISPVSGGSYETDQPSISLAGTASDNIGVQTVAWANSEGGSGTAVGTDSWSVSDIKLVEGVNYISVVVMDAAGNSSSKSLVVTYTPAPLITNLAVASGKSYVIQEGLSERARSYYDHTRYNYSKIPAELLNATYIQTSHGDMGVRNNASFISFNLNSNADVYVVIDDVNKIRPAGMEGFSDTGFDFRFYRTMSVLKQSFSAGPIVFGTNTAGDMYTIIIVPTQN